MSLGSPARAVLASLLCAVASPAGAAATNAGADKENAPPPNAAGDANGAANGEWTPGPYARAARFVAAARAAREAVAARAAPPAPPRPVGPRPPGARAVALRGWSALSGRLVRWPRLPSRRARGRRPTSTGLREGDAVQRGGILRLRHVQGQRCEHRQAPRAKCGRLVQRRGEGLCPGDLHVQPPGRLSASVGRPESARYIIYQQYSSTAIQQCNRSSHYTRRAVVGDFCCAELY